MNMIQLLVWVCAGRSEDCATTRKYADNGKIRERFDVTLNKTSTTVLDTEDVISTRVGLPNSGADDGIQPGAIPPAGQNPDFFHMPLPCYQRVPQYNKVCVFWRSTRVPGAAVSV